MKRDLTVSAAARLLRISRARVLALLASGDLDGYTIPACRQYRARVRVRYDAVERMRNPPSVRVRKTKTEAQKLAEEWGL